ncbi:MAG: hypothetical protein LBQ45_00405 [Mycoplasmataceae bacterium]|jgi:ABC-type Fe3+-citrate transport system substrate-binding protein|nr:hypothetical protein [Mycoplasmataceae bacterium]
MKTSAKTMLNLGVLGVSTFAPFSLDNNNNITIHQKSILNEIKFKFPEQKNSNAFMISHEQLLTLLENNFFSAKSAKEINNFLFQVSVDLANKGYVKKVQL